MLNRFMYVKWKKGQRVCRSLEAFQDVKDREVNRAICNQIYHQTSDKLSCYMECVTQKSERLKWVISDLCPEQDSSVLISDYCRSGILREVRPRL